MGMVSPGWGVRWVLKGGGDESGECGLGRDIEACEWNEKEGLKNAKEGLKNAKETRKRDGRMRRTGKRWNGR